MGLVTTLVCVSRGRAGGGRLGTRGVGVGRMGREEDGKGVRKGSGGRGELRTVDTGRVEGRRESGRKYRKINQGGGRKKK